MGNLPSRRRSSNTVHVQNAAVSANSSGVKSGEKGRRSRKSQVSLKATSERTVNSQRADETQQESIMNKATASDILSNGSSGRATFPMCSTISSTSNGTGITCCYFPDGHHSCIVNGERMSSRQSLDINAGSSDDDHTVERATSKLKMLLLQLDGGHIPDHYHLKHTLSYVMDVLCSVSDQADSESSSECGQLESLVEDEEVRAWLTTTFTHSESRQMSENGQKPSFRAVVETIMAGQYFKRINEAPISYPADVCQFFESSRDDWNCDIAHLEFLTQGQPLKYIGHELFKHYGLLGEYKISPTTLNVFLGCVEEGYKLHGNPYHNMAHAADVTQTIHCLIQAAGLRNWLSSLEVLAMIFSAIIHDLEHTGTTNSFHTQSRSDLALCYNDISVLENYHLYRAFSILTEDSHNILRTLTAEEFSEVRSLVVEMVLSTDMSKHFLHLKHMKKVIASPDAWQQIQGEEKPKVLSLFLHMADISHPGKRWDIHEKWTSKLIEEFFRQGDREKELNLPCSPLCDRNTTAVPESQVGFIDFIVAPAYEVCGETMELIVRETSEGDHLKQKVDPNKLRLWSSHIADNRTKWKLQCKPKGNTSTL